MDECVKNQCQFYWEAAKKIDAISPLLSRHFLGLLTYVNKRSAFDEHGVPVAPFVDNPLIPSVCPYCNSIFKSGNHSMRLKPKMNRTKAIRKLQKKTLHRLTKKQRKLLLKFNRHSVKQVQKCETCKKRMTTYLGARQNLETKSKAKKAFLAKEVKRLNNPINSEWKTKDQMKLAPKSRALMLTKRRSMLQLKHILNSRKGQSSANSLQSFLTSII